MTKNLFLVFSILIFSEAGLATVVDSYDEEKQFYSSSAREISMSATRAFGNLIDQLDDKFMPVGHMKQSLRFIKAVKFIQLNDNIYGVYNRLTKVVTLGTQFINMNNGEVKTLEKLTTDQVAIIYHELWHAYHDSISSRGPNRLQQIWLSQSRSLYRSKGSVIHGEAYGLFAEEIAKSYLYFFRLFSNRTAQSREKLRANKKLESIYLSVFEFKVFGYFRNWRGKFITSTVNLPLKDRINIEQNLFNRKLPRNYGASFPEEKFVNYLE